MNKLLVIDASSAICASVERLYKNDKTIDVVATASNGRDALAKVKHYQPDIVVMDLTLPGMNGLQCIKHMQALNHNIKILAVAALSDVSIGLEALERGAKGFLGKPFGDKELSEAVKKITV